MHERDDLEVAEPASLPADHRPGPGRSAQRRAEHAGQDRPSPGPVPYAYRRTPSPTTPPNISLPQACTRSRSRHQRSRHGPRPHLRLYRLTLSPFTSPPPPPPPPTSSTPGYRYELRGGDDDRRGYGQWSRQIGRQQHRERGSVGLDVHQRDDLEVAQPAGLQADHRPGARRSVQRRAEHARQDRRSPGDVRTRTQTGFTDFSATVTVPAGTHVIAICFTNDYANGLRPQPARRQGHPVCLITPSG